MSGKKKKWEVILTQCSLSVCTLDSRAFYAVTNYLAFEEIQSVGPRVAILDRYYHSTCAYTVSRLSLNDLYRADLAIFEWPLDLPKPNLALQLQG